MSGEIPRFLILQLSDGAYVSRALCIGVTGSLDV